MTTIDARQYALSAMAEVGIENIGAGNGVRIPLPGGAMLLRLAVVGTTAFNSGTTATLTVGDGATTFADGVDMQTVGSKTVANVPKFYPVPGALQVTLAQTGAAATAGKAFVVAEYVIKDRWSENQD